MQFANISPRDKHRFPFENDNIEDNVIIVSRKIEKEYFQRALEYTKQQGGTANDLLVASYIDALKKVARFKNEESISVSCATDLRRHIKINLQSDTQITFLSVIVQLREWAKI